MGSGMNARRQLFTSEEPAWTCTATGPMTAARAARALRVTPKAIRQWVRQGAPCASRERPLLVDPDELRAWRAGTDPLAVLRAALLATYQREADAGKPAHRCLGIPDRQAAALLLFVYDNAHRASTGADPTRPWPDEIAQLRRLAGATD
jgi:hypothetical protein